MSKETPNIPPEDFEAAQRDLETLDALYPVGVSDETLVYMQDNPDLFTPEEHAGVQEHVIHQLGRRASIRPGLGVLREADEVVTNAKDQLERFYPRPDQGEEA